jgi:hypothetical protein
MSHTWYNGSKERTTPPVALLPLKTTETSHISCTRFDAPKGIEKLLT